MKRPGTIVPAAESQGPAASFVPGTVVPAGKHFQGGIPAAEFWP